MREILFRGKRADNGKWEYGDLWCNPYGKRVVCIVSPINDQGTTGGNEVDPETVGQFTGLTDRNGKRIFEGDIVRYGDTIHRVVFEQRNGTAYFGLIYSPIETLTFGHYQDLKQIEVIGNIYDNPELLENNNLEENNNG